MKKLIVMGIIAVMVMSLAAVAFAAPDTDWAVQMRAEMSGTTLATATFGTKSTSTDAFLTTEGDGTYPTAPAPWASIYSVVAGNQLKNDYKGKVLDGQTKVWDLYINGSGAGNVVLKSWVPTSATGAISGGFSLVALTAADGVTILKDDAGKDMIFAQNFAAGVTGSSAAPNFTKTFSFDGATPIAVKLVAVTVPEPGSIVALGSGLVGLVGFAIRRRK